MLSRSLLNLVSWHSMCRRKASRLRSTMHRLFLLEMVRLISRDIGSNVLREMKERREIRSDGQVLLNALDIIQCFHPR
jgi:hypothetical protein